MMDGIDAGDGETVRPGGSGGLIAVATVAIVVLIAALAGAVGLRLHRENAAATQPPAPTTTALTCAGAPCVGWASEPAGDGTAQLLASAAGAGGHLRFTGAGGTSLFEVDISSADIVLTGDSLSCVSGAVPACLVSGDYAAASRQSGGLGEVFVRRGGFWQQAGSTYLYSSTGSFALSADESGDPNVVTVQNDCGQATVADRQGQCADPDLIVRLFAADGTSLGCTLPATSVSLLPGGGTQPPPAYDLHDCPASN